ncbi:MAG: IclR family transcriptional regulator domain-containing protein, partial [Egibacteraceae bacterium]
TGHSGYLARFVGGRVTITAVQESGGSPHVEDLVVGFHEAAHATALGKALLATLTPGDRRAYLAEQGMPRFTSRTITEPERLESQLVRRRHMYVEESQFRDDVSCIAALVATGQRDEPWWAVALSADSGRFRRTAGGLAGALRAAASSLSLQPA